VSVQIGRRFPLKKLAPQAVRPRRFCACGVSMDSLLPQESRTPAPINFVLKEITPFVYKQIIKENRNTLTPTMERERISEINCNFFKEKLRLVSSRSMFKINLSFMLFPVILIGLKKFATLLPNNWLAETPQTLASRRLGRLSAERERISEINCNFFKNILIFNIHMLK